MLSSSYLFPEEKKMIQFEVRHWCTNTEDGVGVGNIFYGDKGVMLIKGYHTYEVYFGQKREPGPKRQESASHYANFIKAVRAAARRLTSTAPSSRRTWLPGWPISATSPTA